MARSDPPEETDLWALVRQVVSRWWILLAIVAAGVLLAVFNANSQRKLYAAEAVVRVVNPNSTSVLGGSSGRPDPAREVSLQVLFARSPEIRSLVEGRLGVDLRRRASVEVSEVVNADAIRIRAESSDRDAAKLVADAFVAVYIEERRKAISAILANQGQRLNDEADQLGAQVSSLSRTVDGLTPAPVLDSSGRVLYPPEPEQLKSVRSQRDLVAARREEVIRQIEQVKFEASVRQGDVELVSAAQLPTRPFSPKPLRDGAVAGTIGLFVGLVSVLALARLDDRVKRTDELDDLVEAPVIAVPFERRDREARDRPTVVVDAGASAGAEAFRGLRAAALFGGTDVRGLAILVTSPSPGEGKTTVAANLAAVIAMSGRRTLLVDLDLYRPSVHVAFKLPASPGFTSLVRGDTPFVTTAEPVPVGDGVLHVVTAGPQVANPAELVLSPRSVRWLETMRENYDVMVCDCPPVMAVADALSLAHLFSGVIVVARAGATRARTVRATLDQLQSRAVPVIAVVLNGVRRGTPYMSTYGTVGAAAGSAPAVVPVPDLDPDRPLAPARRSNGAGAGSGNERRASDRVAVTTEPDPAEDAPRT